MLAVRRHAPKPRIQDAVNRLWILISTIRYLLSDDDYIELDKLHQVARDDDNAYALYDMVRLLNSRYHATGSSFQLLTVQGEHGDELEVREDRF